MNISDSLWDEVTVLRKTHKQKIDKVNAQRGGKTESQCKIQGMEAIHKNRKLDETTDAQKHKTISIDISKSIIAARCEKKYTQDKLAQLINEKKKVIVEYETGKAIVNNKILSKIKNVLGMNKPKPKKQK